MATLPIDFDTDRPLTRAEKAQINRIAHWLSIKREAEAQLRRLGFRAEDLEDDA